MTNAQEKELMDFLNKIELDHKRILIIKEFENLILILDRIDKGIKNKKKISNGNYLLELMERSLGPC